MNGRIWAAILALTILLSVSVHANVLLDTENQNLYQANGSQFRGRIVGDEWFNYGVTDDNKVFQFNALTQDYEYGVVGRAHGLDVVVPSGISILDPWAHWWLAVLGMAALTPEQVSQMFHQYIGPQPEKGVYAYHRLDGLVQKNRATNANYDKSPNLLVILVSFSDIAVSSSDASWGNKIFGSNQGQLNDYWAETTYDSFRFDPAAESFGTANDGIVRVSLSYAHPNPATDASAAHNIARDAIEQLDASMNFAPFDTDNDGVIEFDELQILTVIAGSEVNRGSPSVWPSAKAIENFSIDGKAFEHMVPLVAERQNMNDSTIGVIAHELGHSYFGLPDLYIGDGIGRWGLMGAGSKGSFNGAPGNSPSHFSAWSKAVIGVGDVDGIVMYDASGPIQTGIPLEFFRATDSRYRVIKLVTPDNPREYFLIENRHRSGYDRGAFDTDTSGFFANGGLAIWHVNEDQAPVVELEWPRGDQHAIAQGNLWSAGVSVTQFGPRSNATGTTSHKRNGEESGISVKNISSNSLRMTATVEVDFTYGDLPTIETFNTESVMVGDSEGVRFFGRAQDSDGSVDRVQIRVVRMDIPNAAWMDAPGGENYELRMALANGAYQAYVRAVDNQGYVGGTLGPINFTVADLPEPPVIDSVNITSQGQRLSISGVVTDPDGDAIDSVQLFFNGNFTPVEVNFVGSDGSWTYFDSAFAAGTHQVWVRAVDDTGRISGTVSRDFSVAVSTPPVLSNISITKQGQEVIIRGRAVDAESDLSAVELRFDYDTSQFPPTLYVFTLAGDWEYRRVMSPGDHTVTIRARDADRNYSNRVGPLSFNIPEVTTVNTCVEDFIMVHMAAGRAVACGVIGTDVCAAGSGDPLPGILSMEIVALSETSANVWQRVASCP